LANLGHVSTATGELERAEQNYREGVAAAMSVTAVPWALDSLAGLAVVKARSKAEDQALRIARTVAAHPALYDDTRPVLQAAMDELRARVPAAQLDDALHPAEAGSLESLISEIGVTPAPFVVRSDGPGAEQSKEQKT
jgi:hypothetical protein